MPECGYPGKPDDLVMRGPTVMVDVGFGSLENKGSYSALIDTGADCSCINNQIALLLNLPVIDREKVAGVNGIQEQNVYGARIHIPDLQIERYGRFPGFDAHFGVILGREFLKRLRMEYDGPSGSVILRKN